MVDQGPVLYVLVVCPLKTDSSLVSVWGLQWEDKSSL